MAKIGVLLPTNNDQYHLEALRESLRDIGWTEPGKIIFEVRVANSGEIGQMQDFARELAASGSDILITASSPAAKAVAAMTTEIPIVFINVFDPVSLWLVASLDCPGGNVTGITGFPTDIAASWLIKLKQLVPQLGRVGLLYNPATAATMAPSHMRAGTVVAATLGIEFVALPVDECATIPKTLAAFGVHADSGLIVVPSTFAMTHRQEIVSAITRAHLPAIYGVSPMVHAGGLASYGPNITAQWRTAAFYVDRILHGDRPAHLAVQLAPEIALTINRGAANALGLTLPSDMVADAHFVG